MMRFITLFSMAAPFPIGGDILSQIGFSV
jgi:hypothetical protein